MCVGDENDSVNHNIITVWRVPPYHPHSKGWVESSRSIVAEVKNQLNKASRISVKLVKSCKVSLLPVLIYADETRAATTQT